VEEFFWTVVWGGGAAWRIDGVVWVGMMDAILPKGSALS
jgi:hypothetical protein